MKSLTELKKGKSIGDMYDHSITALLEAFGLKLDSIIELRHDKASDLVRILTRNPFTSNKCLYFVEHTIEDNFIFAGNYDFQYILVKAVPIR